MTTNIVFDEDYRLIGWAAERIGIECFSHDAHAIGLERDGELVAVVVYDRFSPHDCHMHVASDGTKRWLVREFLVACFAYPFIQLGLRRVTGLVPASNAGDDWIRLCRSCHMKFDFKNGMRKEEKIEFNGESRTLQEWAEHLGMKYSTLYARLKTYKMPIDEAFSLPVSRSARVRGDANKEVAHGR
ncbi:acyl-CoA N-acyltransferase [Ralstonia phage RPZH6]|nr:acyl-CoA N-acyltransferase [Ralstonia phage RPZH6]